MSFSLGDYVTVNDRLKAALEKFPDLRVVEKAPQMAEAGGKYFIEVQMTVYRHAEDLVPMVGHAWEEFPGTTPYTRGSEAANAATSCLGRILGYMGFGINKSIATQDDVKHREPQQSPRTAFVKQVPTIVPTVYPSGEAVPDPFTGEQQTTAVSTGRMVWNGNAWVTAGHPAAAVAPTTTTYTTTPTTTTESPAALVAKYTQIYHQWTARGKQHEQLVSRLPVMSKERAEAQGHVDWSKYYADQASRAAHHYHNTPTVPVPFELPPAPPSASTATNAAAAEQPVQQQQPTAATTTDGGPPGSLKRYVHRCLEQCVTPQQKEAAQRETEQAIAKALQAGTLHSTNWDTVPLVVVPGVPIATAPATTQDYQPNHASKKQKVSSTTSHSSYYGPSLGGPKNVPPSSFSSASSPWQSNQQQQQQQYQNTTSGGGGYYGPASASQPSPSSTTTNSFYQSQQQQNGKYDNNDNADFIALPQFGGKNNKKNGFGKNKYVNPNSTKNTAATKKKNMNDAGFKRSSKTLAQRANRFSGPGGMDDVQKSSARGIDDRYMGKGVIGGSQKALDDADYEHMKVKGTCQTLEKQYLRLTAPPKPELVRPLPILQRHLTNLQAEWALGEGKRRDYLWFCAEMKALRQDLTVQHIINPFTCEVYETHARMALQEGDLNEFNQAQTQLKILYDKLEDPKALEHENEFVAYRLIYFVMLSLNQKYNGGSSDMLNLMLSLTASQRKDPAIQHALQVRAAVADVDYHKFFRLNETSPNLGDKLMGLMVPTVRHLALQRICRAYRPVAEVSHVLQEIGLPTTSAKALEDGKTFLLSCGCVLNDDGSEIMTKDSTVRESDLQEKSSLI